ncbi:hypothetical protein DPMN_031730 [Dreissena polymorpha]|uniref:Uncharacterized protein n=1 Tax=Dreissena polymorpha TaxID=45954 RepID=A0A9D4M0J3_DREPO|nr:hypothetical protein DPMN_031730 [Dreissena polymorpha]
MTKFHEDRTINVASRVFTNKCGRTDDGQTPVTKAPLSNQKTKVLTKFHENWAKNVTSRVFTYGRTDGRTDGRGVYHNTSRHRRAYKKSIGGYLSYAYDINRHTDGQTDGRTDGRGVYHNTSRHRRAYKNAPPTGGHVFSPIWNIFELVREINKTNVLTNIHDDWEKIVTSRVFTRKTAPPTGDHVFQRTETTFEPNQHIIKTNILTKLHEDWARNVTSTVFDLDRDFIGTKLLTKFHKDRTINVASRVFTNKC